MIQHACHFDNWFSELNTGCLKKIMISFAHFSASKWSPDKIYVICQQSIPWTVKKCEKVHIWVNNNYGYYCQIVIVIHPLNTSDYHSQYIKCWNRLFLCCLFIEKSLGIWNSRLFILFFSGKVDFEGVWLPYAMCMINLISWEHSTNSRMFWTFHCKI